MRIGVIVVALAVSVLAALFADVNPPSTNARCPNPGPNRPDVYYPWHAGGYYTSAFTPGGVYANIQVKRPWVEPTYDINVSAAWTLISGGVHPSTGKGRYAQTGWIEWRNSGRNNFYAWTDVYGNQPAPRNAGPAFPLNTYHYYTTLYDVNNGWFSFYVDGQWKDSILPGWQPSGIIEIMGEVNTAASQLGGGWGYPMYANDIAVWYNGSWQRPTLTTHTDNFSYFGVWRWGSGAGQNLAVWDQYCQD